MFQYIFARFTGLVVGIDLHHDLIEILDDIFELVCQMSVPFVISAQRRRSNLQRPFGRWGQLGPSRLGVVLNSCLQVATEFSGLSSRHAGTWPLLRKVVRALAATRLLLSGALIPIFIVSTCLQLSTELTISWLK